MGQDGAAGERTAQAERTAGDGASGSDEAVVTFGGKPVRVHGRALRLMLWLLSHQRQINELAAEHGQMWLTWKGNGPHAIEGSLKVPLRP